MDRAATRLRKKLKVDEENRIRVISEIVAFTVTFNLLLAAGLTQNHSVNSTVQLDGFLKIFYDLIYNYDYVNQYYILSSAFLVMYYAFLKYGELKLLFNHSSKFQLSKVPYLLIINLVATYFSITSLNQINHQINLYYNIPIFYICVVINYITPFVCAFSMIRYTRPNINAEIDNFFDYHGDRLSNKIINSPFHRLIAFQFISSSIAIVIIVVVYLLLLQNKVTLDSFMAIFVPLIFLIVAIPLIFAVIKVIKILLKVINKFFLRLREKRTIFQSR